MAPPGAPARSGPNRCARGISSPRPPRRCTTPAQAKGRVGEGEGRAARSRAGGVWRGGDPPIILRPPRDLRIRVGPERVAQHARVGHVHRPRHPLQVGGRVDVGRQPTMDAKDLAIDDGGERQAVEKLLEALPQLDRVAPPGRSGRPASRGGRGPSRPPAAAEPSGTWGERPLGHHHRKSATAGGRGPRAQPLSTPPLRLHSSWKP